MHDNPIEDLECLIAYLSMTDEEKAIEVVYSFGYWIVNETNTIADLLEDESISGSVRQELENLDPEEYQLGELGDETIKAIAGAVDVDEVLALVMKHAPDEYPLWDSAELRSREIQEDWLLHQSDYASDIAYEGFQKGVYDLRMLALTVYLGEAMKSYPGYNYAFCLQDYERYRGLYHRKYGKGLVLFKAPFVYIWHYGDEEPQAIFWGPDATNRYEVFEHYGFYTVELEAEDGEVVEFETNNLEELVEYIERYEIEAELGVLPRALRSKN